MTSEVNIHVPGHIPALRQPEQDLCWATVATIMKSWQVGETLDMRAMLSDLEIGFLDIFDRKEPLDQADLPDFLDLMGMVAEPPMSISVEGIADLISRHGPIWVTADDDLTVNFSIHARILIGVFGDGTPEGTIATIIDPNADSPIEESVAIVQERHAQLAFLDNHFNGNLAQYIHFR